MIYKRVEFIEENAGDERFPVKHVEQLSPTDGGKKKFVGRVSMGVQTPMGVQTLPVTFEIQAETIEAAFAGFEERAETEIEQTKKALEGQLREMRRQEQGRIITPGEVAPGQMGKLQL